MRDFMDEDFLLQSDTARYLYHEHAAKMPIFDYHCHISPQEIAENKSFDTMTEVWLKGDHYKWRAMRTNGVDERFITGDATDSEKFQKWAETVPYTLRNPLHHWTHLELRKPFGIKEVLDGNNAADIYHRTNEMLSTPEFSCQGLIKQANVHTICTTDDPIDTLEYHKIIKMQGLDVNVLPAWRPDKAMAVEDLASYNKYIEKLEEADGRSITTFADLMEVLQNRHTYFHENGCRLSDHGLDRFYAADYTIEEISSIFDKVRSQRPISSLEIEKFKSAMLYEFGVLDYMRGWTQQFHIGALRNNNTLMFNKVGVDAGFDSIGDWSIAEDMSRFLNRLAMSNQLTKTILYNLNPKDNETIATMIGNFQDGSVAGKIQFGSGWWFLDQKDGMIKQMNSLSSLGLLSRFVGMLTDSRSFLSYSRHEYFRRILCNLLAVDVENGEIPNDRQLLGQMVEDISFNNSKNYFKFETQTVSTL